MMVVGMAGPLLVARFAGKGIVGKLLFEKS